MRSPTSLILFTLLIFISCKKAEEAKLVNIFYDTSFPKTNKDLSKIIGNKIALKSGYDTLYLNISSNKKGNLIIDSLTGDTIFRGTVSKFRGLYYFSERHQNGLYWIFAVKISRNLIYGLTDYWNQSDFILEEFKKGNITKLIKALNKDTSQIILFTKKMEMKKIYAPYINSLRADTIINIDNYKIEIQDTSSVLTSIDTDELDFNVNIYPNPAKNILNIELQQKSELTFQINDLNGLKMLEGKLTDVKNEINITDLKSGVFLLTINNQTDKQIETFKIIKTE